MFRILENVDGSTSIFCTNSGKLLCTVPCKANSNAHQRINVVEPQPANPNWQHLNEPQLYSIPEDSTELPKEEKDETLLTRKSLCCLSPIPISVGGGGRESEEEDSYSGVSEGEGFARCLGLVPLRLLHSTPKEELMAEWPLRLLSRSGAYRTSEPKDVKIPDHLPLTSLLGVLLLKLNGRTFASADRLRAHLRSYESFCRHPWNAASSSNAGHFPKLRCREKKTYPVVLSGRVRNNAPYTHTYTRGRRQRRERERTRNAGLDARSRRLFRRCNTRSLRVDVARLPESEIRDWLSRRAPPSSDSESEEEEHYDPSNRPSRRTMAVYRRRNTRIAIPTPKCSVYVRNIVMDIQRRRETHYVKNTHIKVPFFRDFLSSLRSNRPLLNAVYETKLLSKSMTEEIHFGGTRNICFAPPARGGTQKSQLCTTEDSSKDVGKSFLNRTLQVKGTRKLCAKEYFSKGKTSTSFTPSIPQGLVRGQHRSYSKTEQKTKKFTPLEVDLTTEPNYDKKPPLFIPDSSGLEEFSPPEKVCLKRMSSKTMSVLQNSSKHKGSFIASESANRSVQKTKVFIHSSSGFKEFQPSEDVGKVLQRRTQLKSLGSSSRSFVPSESANSSGQKTENSLGALPGGKRGQFMKARKTCTKKSKSLVLNLNTDSSELVQCPGTSTEKISSDSKKSITLIDLTGETTPPRKTGVSTNRPQETSGNRLSNVQHRPLYAVQNQEERFQVSRWKFRCFACGHRRLFFNREQQQVVEKAVRDHLHLYHHVSDAESFLSRYLDSVNHCTVIEAFPGFKGDED